jgi:hypothetical protein
VAVERRTLLLGGGLAAALVALLVVRSMGDVTSPAPNRPAQPGRMPASANAGAQASALDAAKVNLEELERKRLGPADTGRNPFRFEPKVLPAPPPSPTGPTPPTSETPVVPTGPPPPPPISLKFIGLVEKVDGMKIAVLSDGRRPLYGVEGQEIDGRYRILKIGTESIEMAYLDGRGRQTIRLTGQ